MQGICSARSIQLSTDLSSAYRAMSLAFSYESRRSTIACLSDGSS